MAHSIEKPGAADSTCYRIVGNGIDVCVCVCVLCVCVSQLTEIHNLILLLHPVPTCADAGPDLCTLSLRGSHRQQLTVVVLLPQLLAQRLPLHPWWFHPLQLARWCFFFHPQAQIPELHSGNLHCVVVVFWWWWWKHCIYAL